MPPTPAARVPPLPSFDKEQTEQTDSQETIEARKQFWSKFKKPKNQSAELVLASPSPSPQPAARGAEEIREHAPTLPDTPPDAIGRRFESFGLSPPAPPSPAVPTDPPGVERSDTNPPTSASQVAEALTWMTTVDLESGGAPFSFSAVAAPKPTKTAVYMDVGGMQQVVTIDLTPDQCRAAGLRLVSEPEGAVGTEEAKAAVIPAEKNDTEAPTSSNETKDDAQPPSAPAHGSALPPFPPLQATETPVKETQETAEGVEPSGTAPSSLVPQARSVCIPSRFASLCFTVLSCHLVNLFHQEDNGRKAYRSAYARFNRTKDRALTQLQGW